VLDEPQEMERVQLGLTREGVRVRMVSVQTGELECGWLHEYTGRFMVAAVQLNERTDMRDFSPWCVELGRSHGHERTGSSISRPAQSRRPPFTGSHNLVVRRTVCSRARLRSPHNACTFVQTSATLCSTDGI